MKTLILLLLSIYISLPQQIHSQWTLKHSYEEYFEGINSIYFLDKFGESETGFAGDNVGKILKTTDHGETWEIFPTAANGSINAITFIDNKKGFCVGDHGKIMTTVDKGINWQSTDLNNDTDLRTIWFTGDSIGYIGGQGLLLKTVDQWKSWDTVLVDPTVTFLKIIFVSNDTGYVLLSNSLIKKTEDAGKTWKITNTGSMAAINDMFFTSSDTGYAVGGRLDGRFQIPLHFILKTVDGGKDWFLLINHLGIIIYQKVIFTSPDSGFIFADNGAIHMTIDKGINWININPTIAKITSVYITSGGERYVGNLHTIGKSNNTTSLWNYYNSPLSTIINDISFSNSHNGIAVGSNGNILASNDYGEHWSEIHRNFFSIENIESVYQLTDSIFFVLKNGGIFRSTDAGLNWNNVLDSLTQSASCFFSSRSIGYAVDLSGSVFKTVDSGLTWFRLPQNLGVHLGCVYFINNDTGYIGGAYNQYFSTFDGGQTWTKTMLPYNYWVTNIQFFSPTVGFLQCGAVIYKTENSGANWYMISTYPFYHNSEKIEFIDSLHWYAVFDHFFKTNNAGKTWYDIPLDSFISSSQIFRSISFINKDTGFIGGNNGIIVKTTNAGGSFTKIQTESYDLPINFAMDQNYPNPFNPITNISFSIPSRTIVSLKIFDLVGREIATIYSGEMLAGDYTKQWNAANYPSGIYFYRLQTSLFSETKKLVLLK